jgi:hypothetical protein
MTDTLPPAKQRPALLAFAEACVTRPNDLRRDECGDWAIWGNNGHVYAVPEGYQLMTGCDFDNRGLSKRREELRRAGRNNPLFAKKTAETPAPGIPAP